MANENEFPKIDGDILYGSEATFQAGNFLQLITGENISDEDAVYVKQSDGKVYQSGTGTADDIRVSGLAKETKTVGNAIMVQVSGNFPTTGLTANRTYYLSTTGSISLTRSAIQVGFSASTTSLMINIIQDDRDAIGMIKSYHKSFTGIPANNVSAFWVECSGQVLSDTESPLNGQTIPDLNGDNRFLRGNSTSGGEGGTENHQHETPFSGDSSRLKWSFTPAFGTGANVSTNRLAAADGSTTFNDPAHLVSSEGTLPTYMEVVWIIKIK